MITKFSLFHFLGSLDHTASVSQTSPVHFECTLTYYITEFRKIWVGELKIKITETNGTMYDIMLTGQEQLSTKDDCRTETSARDNPTDERNTTR